MSTTDMLTGMLPMMVLISSLLAVPVSFLLLRWYRSAVQKRMNSISQAATAVAERDPARRAPSSTLRLETIDSSSIPFSRETALPAYRQAMRGPWRAAMIYTAAGACYALMMTAGWLAATQDDAIVPTKVLLLFWTYLWPAVLAVVLVAAYDRRRRLQVFGVYFFTFLAISAIGAIRNPEAGLGSLLLYWTIQNGPPTVLVVVFLLRPIRAVGPIVLAFLLVLVIGSESILLTVSADDAWLMAVVDVGLRFGLDASGMFAGMILLGMLVFGMLGWPLFRYLGNLYERKKLSDQSILLDALWLQFGVVQSIGFAFQSPAWVLTGLVAFAGYKLALRFGFRVLDGGRDGDPLTLLQLRVFALGKRSERLFDRLRKHWQYAGSITLVAGPDLVTSTVEPHEFLDFVSGRLGRRFVADDHDLERRIVVAEEDPAADGRYHVHEFFCHANTWRMTMERLAAASDAVMMDLRSFTPANQGCIFELSRLLDEIDLRQIVFLVDETTEIQFLEATLQRLWLRLSSDSPNQSAVSPTARFFPIKTQSERELSGLLRLLMIALPKPVAAAG
jgi:hypothetical protein